MVTKSHQRVAKGLLRVLVISHSQIFTDQHNCNCVKLPQNVLKLHQSDTQGLSTMFPSPKSSSTQAVTQLQLCHPDPKDIFGAWNVIPKPFQILWSHHHVNLTHGETIAVVSYELKRGPNFINILSRCRGSHRWIFMSNGHWMWKLWAVEGFWVWWSTYSQAQDSTSVWTN